MRATGRAPRSNPVSSNHPSFRHLPPRILIAEPDPYLRFLIQLEFPDFEVVEPDELTTPEDLIAQHTFDVVVLDLGSPSAGRLLDERSNTRLIGIVDRSVVSRSAPPADLEAVLVRPFLPAELYRALRRTLEIGDGSPQAGSRQVEHFRSWLGPARLAAVAIAAVFELAASVQVSGARAGLLAFAFLYAALRLRGGAHPALWTWVDALAAAALLGATGGLESNYFGFALVVVAGVGLHAGARAGAIAGLLVVLGSTHAILAGLGNGRSDLSQLALTALALPFAGLAAALAERIWPSASSGTQLLAEANEVLSTLYRIARAVPGGLELGSVAAATMEEVRETLGAPAGALFVGDAGVLRMSASFGLPQEGDPVIRTEDATRASMLDPAIRPIAGPKLPAMLNPELYPCWLAAPLRHNGVTSGTLVAACADHARHEENRLFLQQLAQEAAVAVENARLYSRLGQLSADEERARLARELHDGVAQALAHVRFELEFLARHGAAGEAATSEIARLARVAERALADVRSTISGLRATVAEGGVADSLRLYLRDLRSLGGPEITFTRRGTFLLPDDVQSELFRIAQESVSNALRHARASRVQVSLEEGTDGIRLTVSDDGIGLGSNPERATGMGLKAIEERAHRIDAKLEIRSEPGVGTTVEVFVEHDETRTAKEGAGIA